MPQMTSEEEGPWPNSLPLEHLKCKTSQSNPIMWALKTDQVATTSKWITKLGLETSLQEGYTLTDWETWLNQKIS
jgi:hypothetical protein